MSTLIYKITIDNIETGKTTHLYVNTLDSVLQGEFFNTPITDAKTNDKVIFKDLILRGLEEDI